MAGNQAPRRSNVQERFNGTFRAFQRPRRGIKGASSRIIIGFFIHYNFVRPHTALGGCTPARRPASPSTGARQVEDDNRQRRPGGGGSTARHLGVVIRMGSLRIPTGPAGLFGAPPKDGDRMEWTPEKENGFCTIFTQI